MRLLQTLLLMLLAFSPCALFAEDGNGVVKGTVKTTDGKAAAMVSVTLKNTKKSTITDENGAFLLNNVKPGTYTLQVTLLGHGAKKKLLSSPLIIQPRSTSPYNCQISSCRKWK